MALLVARLLALLLVAGCDSEVSPAPRGVPDSGAPDTGASSAERDGGDGAPDSAARDGAARVDATAADGGRTTTVEVICRSAWGAAEPLASFTTHTLEWLTVHHTAVELDDNTGAPARVRAHQRFHQQDRGWADLAYHFVVDRNGHIYEGRPFDAVGDTATSYDPTGHFLVVAEGNFETQTPNEPQLAAVASMMAWASYEHGIGVETLGGHRDYAETSCPGASLGAFVDDGTLADMIRTRLESGPVRLSSLCGAEGAARVAEIEAGSDRPYEWP